MWFKTNCHDDNEVLHWTRRSGNSGGWLTASLPTLGSHPFITAISVGVLQGCKTIFSLELSENVRERLMFCIHQLSLSLPMKGGLSTKMLSSVIISLFMRKRYAQLLHGSSTAIWFRIRNYTRATASVEWTTNPQNK